MALKGKPYLPKQIFIEYVKNLGIRSVFFQIFSASAEKICPKSGRTNESAVSQTSRHIITKKLPFCYYFNTEKEKGNS